MAHVTQPSRPRSFRVTAAMALAVGAGAGLIALAGLTIAIPRLGAAAFAFAVAAATVAGAFSRAGWPWELAANFAAQLAVASGVAAAAALGTGQLGLVLLALAAVVWNLARIARTPASAPITPAAASAGGEDAVVTVVWANLWGRAAATERLAALARAEGADIIGFAEGPPDDTDLDALFPDHPHRLDSAEHDLRVGGAPTRVAIVSRFPLEDQRLTDDPGPGRAIARATVRRNGAAPLRVFATHPMPAKTPRHLRDRDAMIALIRREAEALDAGRYVVMGDFNLAPSAPAYRLLPGRRAGGAWRAGTWLTRLPGVGLTIDHIMVGDGVAVRDARLGPAIGSDHFPVIARVSAF